MAAAPPRNTRIAGRRGGAPPRRAPRRRAPPAPPGPPPPPPRARGPGAHRHHHDERHERSQREAHGRDGCGLERPRQVVGIEAQLVSGVGGEGVVLGERDGHLARQRLGQAALLVDRGELGQLRPRHGLELLGLRGEVGPLGVSLRRHRAVLPDRHRPGAGHHRRHTGGQQHRPTRRRRRHAHQEARGGQQPVVGPEHAGAQPRCPVPGVLLHVVAHPGATARAREPRTSRGSGARVPPGSGGGHIHGTMLRSRRRVRTFATIGKEPPPGRVRHPHS